MSRSSDRVRQMKSYIGRVLRIEERNRLAVATISHFNFSLTTSVARGLGDSMGQGNKGTTDASHHRIRAFFLG